jgi:hypothetical protein
VLFVSFFALSACAFAQGHEHHGGAAPEAPAQNLPEIAPAAQAKAGDEPGKAGGGGMESCKCKKGGGMGGGHQGHGGGGGMGGGHQGHGGGGDSAALERRVNELEKRLDLMQLLLMKDAR